MARLELTGEDLLMVQHLEAELRLRPINVDARLQALLWWVINRGSIEQLREVLTAGADPNFTYNDGNTSLGLVIRWRSEKANAVEFFQELIRAGADPTRFTGRKTLMFAACEHGNTHWAIGPLLEFTPRRKMSQADLNQALLAAAGDPPLISRLLAAGASANHRGTVNNAFMCTSVSALMVASSLGNHEAVKLLLAAGTDINSKDDQGHTALDYALADPKACRKVIALLKEMGGVSAKPFPRSDDTCRGFATAAKRPAYKQAVARIKELTGIKPSRLEGADERVPGGQGFLFDTNPEPRLVEGRVAEFAARTDAAREFVERHHAQILAQGFYLFYSRDILSRSGDVVALLPTADVYRVIAALETNGADSTEKLIAWLRELEQDQPFTITGIGADFIEGKFTTPIKDPVALVKRINEICPDGSPTLAEIATQIDRLRRTNQLYLWWD
jgi:ankyrin repeat protein